MISHTNIFQLVFLEVFLLNYYLVYSVSINPNAADPVLALQQGIIHGGVSTSIDGVQFYRFLGIPYAKPPINELRFKAPVPLEHWDGILNATQDGSGCATGGLFEESVLTENCLFLNVYTKQIGGLDLKPVLFWIHGGAFITGSGSSHNFSADFFLNEDVVIVTINYRLDLFGFLALSDVPEYPGNSAFKDQVLALKWVQTNINKFGGDPKKVTIFGESAGSMSVHLLLMSPLAKGLFHRAIAQSGVSISQSARNFTTQELAQSLGLNNSTTKDSILKELSQKSSRDIIGLKQKIQPKVGQNSLIGFTIEKNSSEAFLVEHPIQSILRGNYNQVPLIIGYCNYEGAVIDMMRVTGAEQSVPPLFGYPENSTERETVSKKMRDFYVAGNSEQKLLKRLDLLTDKYFLSEIFFSARYQIKTSKEPVYMYRFSANSTLNGLKPILNYANQIKGAVHGDDVGYLFKSDQSPAIKPGSVEDVTRRRLVRLWSNFAKSGNPTPSRDNLVNVTWTPVTNNTINIYGIDEQSITLFSQEYPEKQRVAFWDQLFKESPTGRALP